MTLKIDVEVGQRVKVRTISGAVVERVVVDYSDFGPLLATQSEYNEALEQGRKPQGIGWPADHIIGPV